MYMFHQNRTSTLKMYNKNFYHNLYKNLNIKHHNNMFHSSLESIFLHNCNCFLHSGIQVIKMIVYDNINGLCINFGLKSGNKMCYFNKILF